MCRRALSICFFFFFLTETSQSFCFVSFITEKTHIFSLSTGAHGKETTVQTHLNTQPHTLLLRKIKKMTHYNL